MFLILGEADDPLATAVERRLAATGGSVLRLGEADITERCSFALARSGSQFSGFLRLGGDELCFDDISGVLVRLPRRWWPSAEFDQQDQMFVYHETTAAWFALLSGLSCPVVNRYGLGWWVRDAIYPALLLEGLQARQAQAAMASGIADTSAATACVYVAGSRVIAASPAAAAAAGWLARESAALASWQEATGISVCRLDLVAGAEPDCVGIEVFPEVQAEPPELVERLAAAVAEVMS